MGNFLFLQTKGLGVLGTRALEMFTTAAQSPGVPCCNSPTTSQVPSFRGPAANWGPSPCSFPQEGSSFSPFDMLQIPSLCFTLSHPTPAQPSLSPLSLTPISSLRSPTLCLTSTPDSFHLLPRMPFTPPQLPKSNRPLRIATLPVLSFLFPLCHLSKSGMLRVLEV